MTAGEYICMKEREQKPVYWMDSLTNEAVRV